MITSVNDRQKFAKILNSKTLYVIGNNGIIYPCVVGGYDIDSFVIFIKNPHWRQDRILNTRCFSMRIFYDSIYDKRYRPLQYQVVNNEYEKYHCCRWLSFNRFGNTVDEFYFKLHFLSELKFYI